MSEQGTIIGGSPMTQQDVRALRHADSIVFRFNAGQGTMEAKKEGRRTPDGFDQTHYVYVDNRVNDYDKGAKGDRTYSAFHMEQSAQYSPTTVTLMGRIGKGDVVCMVWVRGNDSENMRSVGYHCDTLTLAITKPSGKTEHYLVDSQVGPDNTARMVRVSA